MDYQRFLALVKKLGTDGAETTDSEFQEVMDYIAALVQSLPQLNEARVAEKQLVWLLADLVIAKSGVLLIPDEAIARITALRDKLYGTTDA